MTVIASQITGAYTAGSVTEVFAGAQAGDFLAAFAVSDTSSDLEVPAISTTVGTTSAWTTPANLLVDDEGANFFSMRGAYTDVTATGSVTVQATNPANTTEGVALVAFLLRNISGFDDSEFERDTSNTFQPPAITPASFDAWVVGFGLSYGSPTNTPAISGSATNGGTGATYAGSAPAIRASYEEITSGNAQLEYTATNNPNYSAMMVFTESAGGVVVPAFMNSYKQRR